MPVEFNVIGIGGRGIPQAIASAPSVEAILRGDDELKELPCPPLRLSSTATNVQK